MSHLRSVVQFDTRKHDSIARVRMFSDGLLGYIESLRDTAAKQRRAVKSATSVEQVVYRYGRWIGWYRNIEGGIQLYRRQLDDSPIHRQAVDTLRCSLASIDETLKSVHPWLSLPNLENTKFNALRLLDGATSSLDVTFSSLKQLQGHGASKPEDAA